MHWYIWDPADGSCLWKTQNPFGGRNCWKKKRGVHLCLFLCVSVSPLLLTFFFLNVTMIRLDTAHSSLLTIMDCILSEARTNLPLYSISSQSSVTVMRKATLQPFFTTQNNLLMHKINMMKFKES